ncbi:hypothetical protein BLNAU_1743 [Blattamonas nauphoetae]|uniref:Uncharacterized protein n=1 Tax=Blattamonas nauphoetae TaxID=2049346 RepID=A0ABQ9YHJ7_9EUKA|nr:hypothetical protein BLNAU_1743 [Blattamonas nauphoetae]
MILIPYNDELPSFRNMTSFPSEESAPLNISRRGRCRDWLDQSETEREEGPESVTLPPYRAEHVTQRIATECNVGMSDAMDFWMILLKEATKA